MTWRGVNGKMRLCGRSRCTVFQGRKTLTPPFSSTTRDSQSHTLKLKVKSLKRIGIPNRVAHPKRETVRQDVMMTQLSPRYLIGFGTDIVHYPEYPFIIDSFHSLSSILLLMSAG
jgi:hypothetical protein